MRPVAGSSESLLSTTRQCHNVTILSCVSLQGLGEGLPGPIALRVIAALVLLVGLSVNCTFFGVLVATGTFE